jgi:hypothetical protein
MADAPETQNDDSPTGTWRTGTGLEARFEAKRVLQMNQQATAIAVVERATNARQLCKVFAKSAVSSYRRELAAAVQFKHPNVLQLAGTFSLADGRPCLLYPFAEGGTLGQFLEINPIPPRSLTASLLRQILAGLAHMHGHGWLHCDLKPENLFFVDVPTSDAGHLIIGDLGAASTAKEARTSRHSAGTPAYAAPERVYDTFDERADLYSVGIIGFQLLTGRLPYTGTVTEILRGHLGGSIEIGGEGDDPLASCVRRLLQKNPSKRPQSAAQALEELSAASQHSVLPTRLRLDETADIEVEIAAPHAARPAPARFPIKNRATRVAVGNQPYSLAIEYAASTEICDLTIPDGERLTCIARSFAVDRDGVMLGLFGEQYCRIEGVNRRREVLANGAGEARAISVQGDSVVWTDGRTVHIRRDGQDVVAIRHHAYGAQPVVAHWGDLIAVTGGLGNERIVLFDSDGEKVERNLLCAGPIVSMGVASDRLLVASLELDGERGCRFYIFDHEGARSVTLDGVRLVSACVSGAILAVRNESELWYVDASLAPTLWVTLDAPCHKLALSPCRSAAGCVVQRGDQFEALFIHGPVPIDLENA